jgi:hypothetical protein
MDHLQAAPYWRAAYRTIIPVLEQVLVDMRLLTRNQAPIRRVEVGLMDIALVNEQLAEMVERLAYWDRVAAATAMDA